MPTRPSSTERQLFLASRTNSPTRSGSSANAIRQLRSSTSYVAFGGAGVLDRGSSAVQDVAALVALRNGLTHFKPQWDTDTAAHARISRLLEGKFEPSSLILDEPVFPRRWACYACACWAVDACRDFLLMIEEGLGLPEKVGIFRERIQVAGTPSAASPSNTDAVSWRPTPSKAAVGRDKRCLARCSRHPWAFGVPGGSRRGGKGPSFAACLHGRRGEGRGVPDAVRLDAQPAARL